MAVSDSPYQLDASNSIDPNGQYLTYRWSSDKPAAFWPSSTTPVPLLTFQNGAGNYTISLVVTNTSGVSSTSKVTLAYLDKSCSKLFQIKGGHHGLSRGGRDSKLAGGKSAPPKG